MPFATAEDGVRLYYEELGSGEPLLLISGQGGDHRTWDQLPRAFASDYRVIVYDHRGTGQSDKPESPPYTIRGFTRDALAVLDHLGIARAHAYGFSMGGRIGQWLGIHHRDRLGALVLGGTSPGNRGGARRPQDVDQFMRNRPTDPEQALQAMLERFVTPAWAAAHPDYVERARARFNPPIPRYAQEMHYAASEAHDAWDQLPRIKAPTLVIHGGDDRTNPTENAPLLARRIPGAELHMVQGARHAYFLEFPEESTRVAKDFLSRHPL